MSDMKIRNLCVSILCDYQGLEEHDAWEYVNKMPFFYPSACAAILFTHGECSSDRARKLRDYLYLKDINDTPFGV
jgi:hypothetical protein